MKLLTQLSTVLTLALVTTVATANTNVTTTALAKAQPINAAELINTVELNLVQSMEQLRVTFVNDTVNNQKLLISQAKSERNAKAFPTKLSLAAE
jgi:allophanate hydrolase subunit 1